jgi:hypothetical protein
MRKAIVSIIALAVLVWAADRAQAAIRSIGKHSVSDVRRGCSAVGGSFSVHADGGGYGCIKKNCDGKGGWCQVQCDNNNNCQGATPGRTLPKSLHGVLTGGEQSAQPDTPPSRPPKGGTVSVTGSGILDGGSGFGSQGPAATGSPAGGSAAPPRAQGGGRVN